MQGHKGAQEEEDFNMGWIATIILGGIAGWLASLVMNRDASMGIFWNIVVGIVGGMIGSGIGNVTGFLTTDAGWVMYLITATIGAVVLLGIVNMVQRGRMR
jgi:uncharacterized membrane protein YeaQ/YmgE (transglycosylase-associated protein family)